MSEAEDLIERYQRRVFTFAHYFLSQEQEAEDVTQEVLIKIWRKGRRVSPEKLEGWVIKVTRNACYDRLRKRRSGRRVFDDHDDGEALESATSPWPDPEHSTRGRELSARIEAALGGLSDSYREVVVLREIQGLSYQEIADATSMSLAAVKVTLHRARRKLRESLEEEEIHVATA